LRRGGALLLEDTGEVSLGIGEKADLDVHLAVQGHRIEAHGRPGNVASSRSRVRVAAPTCARQPALRLRIADACR
jgi:hypothetical protein